MEGHPLSGKPKNDMEFDSCQSDVRKLTKSQGKTLSGENNFAFGATPVFSSIVVQTMYFLVHCLRYYTFITVTFC